MYRNSLFVRFTDFIGSGAAAAAKSRQLCPTLCDPIDGLPPGAPSLGFSRQEHWSGLPFPSPTHESEKWKWSRLVVFDCLWPHDRSPPGSSLHGILQARVLEWVAIAFSHWKWTAPLRIIITMGILNECFLYNLLCCLSRLIKLKY